MDTPLAAIEKRLASLEAQIHKLQPAAGAAVDAVARHTLSIRAHFGRVALERKPFVVTLDGVERISRTLTPIRTAILLVLLMDLLERSEAGDRQAENAARVRDALSALAPDEQVSDDAVRVALYRAGQFLNEEFAGTIQGELTLSVKKGRLELLQRGLPVSPEAIEVEITTSDQAISSFLDRSLATSPLARLRKSKTMFVPSGEDGQDRLLLELLDHDYPVKQTCLFYRPTIQSFPYDLLAKFSLNSRRITRQELAVKGYQSGRLQYTEVLPRRILWELAARQPGRGFATYPSGSTATDVIRHLDHLQFLIRSFPSYELVLTDAFLPFYLTTFEITRADAVERFVLFFQHAEAENLQHVSVFALKDDSVFFSTHERIINWILSHPTTIRNPEHVLEEIGAVRRSLLESIESPKTLLMQPAMPGLIPQLEAHTVQKAEAASPEPPASSADGNQANRRLSSL